ARPRPAAHSPGRRRLGTPAGRASHPRRQGRAAVQPAGVDGREAGHSGRELRRQQRGPDPVRTARMKRLTSLLPCLGFCLALPVLADERPAGDTLSDTGGASDRLAVAAMERDLDTVRQLLAERGAEPNALGPYATPALHWI